METRATRASERFAILRWIDDSRAAMWLMEFSLTLRHSAKKINALRSSRGLRLIRCRI
jgi:hypothetical protein